MAAGNGSMRPNRLSRSDMASVAVVHLAAVTLTWRDLRARTDGQVRGSKRMWRTLSALNTTGSVAYWVIGRRRPHPPG